MAKFRRGHDKQGSAGLGALVKVGFLAFILVAAIFGLIKYKKNLAPEAVEKIPFEGTERFYLPASPTGEIIHHRYYSLAYNETHEQAEWVAYELWRNKLRKNMVKRTNDFREDSAIKSGSAELDDYRGSGFDRGHLVPAGDMAFTVDAMSETFLMSNISPQVRGFNHGIWRELEELTRKWAMKFGHLYVVSGPVYFQTPKKLKGSRISIPDAFFKALLDLTEPEKKAIAFVVPNQRSTETLDKFAVSIDSLEGLVQMDFFPVLMEDQLENQLEAKFEMTAWPTDPKKYRIRIEKWNFE